MDLTDFVVYRANGVFDKAETLKRFEKQVSLWLQNSEEMRPVIISSIRSWGKLAEQTLIYFTLQSLNRPPVPENINKVKSVLSDLLTEGKIVKTMNSHGGKRGRKSVYMINAQMNK